MKTSEARKSVNAQQKNVEGDVKFGKKKLYMV
jgi:hypothetical protein